MQVTKIFTIVITALVASYFVITCALQKEPIKEVAVKEIK